MQSAKTGPDKAWYGFLAMCFLVVGLAGLFASYTCQIPYERGEAAQHILDQVAAAGTPAPFQTQLGENAPILAGPGPLARKIEAARAATRARTMAEGEDIARRGRIILGVITCGATLFGCILLGAASNQRKG